VSISKCPECGCALKGLSRKDHAAFHWGGSSESHIQSLSQEAQARFYKLTGKKPSGSK